MSSHVNTITPENVKFDSNYPVFFPLQCFHISQHKNPITGSVKKGLVIPHTILFAISPIQ